MNPILRDSVNIFSFGEILWDIIEGEAHLGGAAFNLAAHAAKLGLNAELVSRVGSDDLGRRAIDEAKRLRVGTSFVEVDSRYPTGTVTVTVASDGQPEYEIGCPAAWDHIHFEEQSIKLRQPDAICFGTLAQRNLISRRALASLLRSVDPCPVFYDVNLRQTFYSKEVIEWGFNRASVVKMNNQESRLIGNLLLDGDLDEESCALRLRDRYRIPIVLVTLGASGCLVIDHTGATHIPGRSVKVVDTIGAGDAFSATFLAGWLRGLSPQHAVVLANRVGAYVASQRGAIPEYGDEIEQQLMCLLSLRCSSPAARIDN